MRDRQVSPNGLVVRPVGGTYVVLLGLDLPAAKRQGLLGFSIHRTDHTEETAWWLPGALRFASVPHDAGEEVSSQRFPIQKFRWGDYTAKPNHRYTYRVEARYGKPDALVTRDTLTVQVTTEDPKRVGGGPHQVHFNRSAAASQAYVRRFGDRDPDEVPDEAAYRWLSRGLEESLVEFIERAQGPSDSLHLCVYEFEKHEFLEALRAAAQRGAHLEIVYDAIVKLKKDKKTGKQKEVGPRRDNQAAIKRHGLANFCHPRDAISAISHNKFMVHSRNGQPLAVWTGSTNFTDGAIYGQANVGHAVEDAALAKKFLDLHQALKADPGLAGSRQSAEMLSPAPPPGPLPLYPIFSPRTGLVAIQICKDLIDQANDLVCFTVPFALHDDLEDALDDPQDRFLKFGLLDKPGNVVEGVHRARNNRITAATRLETKLDVFQKDLFEPESFHHQGVYIHTKYILIDPLSANPTVVTGSANFSTNSSKSNDENQLVIRGDKAVADVYLGEFMRMFDHYNFRYFMKKTENKPKERALNETDAWTNKYYAGGREERDRTVFSS